MSLPLRVLLIEDEEDDALLLRRELERGGYILHLLRVTTAEELSEALDTDSWDIILADYTLPRFDAPSALAMVRARLPDIPFIIVSGTVGEEAVVKCMRDGANDFFLKGRLKLLPLAISREIEAAQVRHQQQSAEQQLRETERRLAHLFSSSPVPYSVTQAHDQRVVMVNPAYCEMTGYSVDEIIGHTVAELNIWVHAHERAALLNALAGPLPVRNFEFQARRKDGTLGDILLTADIIDFNGVPCVLSMALDITERKRAEAHDQMQVQLLNAIGQSVVVIDLNGIVTYWNRAAEQIFGWSAKEALGRNAGDLIVSDDQARHGAEIMARLVRGESWSGEFIVKHRNGSTFPAYVTNAPLTDQSGNLIGIVGVSADISNIKMYEQQILESETLHRIILENVSDAVLMTDDQGYFTFISPSVQDVLGYTPVEIAATGTIQNLLSHEAVRVDGLTEDGDMSTLDITLTLKDGLTHVLIGYIKRVTVGAGTLLYVFRDVTERRRTVEALVESELRFRMMTENARDLYMLVDSKGHCIYASPAYHDLLGYDPQSLVGKSMVDLLVHPDDSLEGVDWRNLPLGRNRLRTASGDWLLVEGYTYTINLDDGEYVVAVARDISERLQLEAEQIERERLNLELEQQKAINDLKGRFVSMVSHEFRNPLAAIQTSSDLLSRYIDRMTEERRAEHLTQIGDQVRQLVKLLDEVLMLSRADSVGLAFNPILTDIEALCQDVVTDVERAAGNEGRVQFNSAGPIHASLDVNLFRQALGNLLSNALKYSPATTRVQLDVSSENGMLVIQVEDHGIGIPKADQALLFDAFHRASNVGNISGTGLGLAIVKRAVDAHGGSVTLCSEVGHGTTFTLTIPLNSSLLDP
jgi:PAS domain S-box-containing protein